MSATVAPWNLEPISVTIAEATRLLGFKDSKTVYNLIIRERSKPARSGEYILSPTRPSKNSLKAKYPYLENVRSRQRELTRPQRIHVHARCCLQTGAR